MQLPHISTLVSEVKQEEARPDPSVPRLPSLRSLDILGLHGPDRRGSSSSESSMFSTGASLPVTTARDLNDAHNHHGIITGQGSSRYEPYQTIRPRNKASQSSGISKRSQRSASASLSGSELSSVQKNLEKRKAKAEREKGSRSSLGGSMVHLQDTILTIRGNVPEYFTPLKSNNAKNSGLDWKKKGVVDAATETIRALKKKQEEMELENGKLKAESDRLSALVQYLQRNSTSGPRL